MNSSVFEKTKYFIIDMDGTFYLDGNIIDGSDRFISALTESGRDFYFFTNNSSNNAKVCVNKLAQMGFFVDEKKIMISSHVAIDYIKKNCPEEKVFLLGNENLRSDFEKAEIPLTQTDPQIVVLGFDTTLTYQKMWDAVRFLEKGAGFIATHPDTNCPTAGGYMPDTGSMIELFAASTGRRPLVLGKPMTPTVNYITSLLNCEKEELAFVGDRLETDIAIGQNHGIPCALVLSGVTDREKYENSLINANVVINRLENLIEYL